MPSHREQSIDMQSKSIDWFLYDGQFGVQWVKVPFDYSEAYSEPCKKSKIERFAKIVKNFARLFILDF